MRRSEDETQLDRPQAQDPLAARLFAGAEELAGYVVARELARGGQGAVYLAHDRRTSMPVAVKLLLDARDGEASLRFLRESDVLIRLMHPHLPRVLTSGRCAGGAFMIMEFVNGVDLKRTAEARGIPDFAWSGSNRSSLG